MLAASEEAELVRRAQDGDETAFVQLVTEYRDRTWAVCMRITSNTQDAEDALQEALTAAWRHLARFRNDSRFGTWLHRIAANAALAVLRRRRETAVDIEDFREEWSVPDMTGTTDDRDRLVRALMSMNEDFRVALVLREVGDLT